MFDTTDCGCDFSSLTFLHALQGAGFGPHRLQCAGKAVSDGDLGAAQRVHSVQYPLSTAQIISEVNTALQSCDRNTILSEASRLDGFNNGPAGCPLGGPASVSFRGN